MPLLETERSDRKVFKKMRLSDSLEVPNASPMTVGVIIQSCRTTYDRHIKSIVKPGSRCSLTALVVLDTSEREDSDSTKLWLKQNGISNFETLVRWGETGFEELLKSNVDSVYIIVPDESQKDFTLKALRAGKHVLINDPLSTSLADFKEQQQEAKEHKKFIMFMTMFVHQYTVRRFIDRVLCDHGFGQILKIDCFVRLAYSDVEKVGVKLPIGKNDGSIRVLGRFCVLVSALFFSRVGIYVHSAKVNSVTKGDNGEILTAQCTVKFSEGRELEFDVGYTQRTTRQQIDITAATRIATMKDFIIEHPDRLATYRVYDRAPSSSGALEIVSGQSIDVAGGPPEGMMMWRRFASNGQSLDKQGGWDQSESTAECRELANVAFQTKRILIALMKSFESSFEEIVIDDIDYQ